jgi:hypothetical protein
MEAAGVGVALCDTIVLLCHRAIGGRHSSRPSPRPPCRYGRGSRLRMTIASPAIRCVMLSAARQHGRMRAVVATSLRVNDLRTTCGHLVTAVRTSVLLAPTYLVDAPRLPGRRAAPTWSTRRTYLVDASHLPDDDEEVYWYTKLGPDCPIAPAD